MAVTDDQILKQLVAMSTGIGKMGENIAAMARASGARVDGRSAVPGEVLGRKGGTFNSTRKAEAAAESYDKASKDFLQTAKGMRNIRSSFNKWNEAVTKSGGYLAGLEADFRHFGGNIFSVGQQARKIVDGMGRYSSEMAKATKSQSLLYASQLRQLSDLKDFEQAAAYEKLGEALDQLSEGQKRALGVLDEATGNLRTDLNFEELAQARAALGNVMGDIAENLKDTDFKSLKEMAAFDPAKLFKQDGIVGGAKANANIQAAIKIAAQLEKSGLGPVGGISMLDKNGGIRKDAVQAISGRPAEFVRSLAAAFEKLEKTTHKTDRAIDALSTPVGKLGVSLTTAEGRLGLFNKGMAYFLTTAALKKGADGLKKLYQEVLAFNTAQVPASFVETYKAAVQMGVGFGEATKILQENKRTLAILGPSQFSEALSGFKKTFAGFGYTMAQGAELVGPAVEQAIASGVNSKDANALNVFMNDTMKSFQKLSGVVNISAKEYIAQNAALLKSEGTFESMMGMDTVRRQAYARDLIQQRDRYAIQGLEMQQAQKLVELQQQQQREKVSNRFTEAAKMLTMMQLNGMGGQSMEAYRLALKGVRTGDEDSRLTQLLGQSGQAFEQRRRGAYGINGDSASGYGVDIQGEALQLGGALGEMQRQSLALRAAKEGGADATGVAGRASGLAQGNSPLANFANVINSISTVMQSALLAATIGTAISFVALTRQANLLRGAFGSMGGAAGTSGTAGKTAGKGGGWKGKLGKGIGGGLLGAGVTIGAAYAGDALINAGHAKTGGTVDTLGTAAGWGLTGAAIGSVIPGVGTLIGGAVGGAAGLAKGAHDNWGNFATPAGDIIKVPTHDQNTSPTDINSSATGGLLPVKDVKVADQLVIMTDLTNQMVKILTQIADKDVAAPMQLSKSSQSVVKVIPAYSFTTGRT